MKIYINSILTLFITFTSFSCTEEMDIDLNDSEKQIVIEANVSTANAPMVEITSSVNFNATNDFSFISGASVELLDTKGNAYTLYEESGFYTNDKFKGTVGEIYTLHVSVENQHFNAVCQIPAQVKLDSVSVIKTEDSGMFGSDNDSIYEVTVHFQDVELADNYYLFIEYINGEQVKSYAISDFSADGMYFNRKLRNSDRELQAGDTLNIEMRCITEDVYDYFNELGSSSFQTATPTNPPGNINKATLGYFSAYTSESKQINLEY